MEKAAPARPRAAGHRINGEHKAESELYPNRRYERRLVESGRRVINVDLDAVLIEKIDTLRGKKRRGLMLDKLIAEAIDNLNEPEAQMR